MMGRSQLRVAAAALMVLGLGTLRCNALNNNPCTEDWVAGQQYDTFQCDGNTVVEWAVAQIPRLVFPMVLGFMVWFACPFFFCGRYVCQCCGSSRSRPGHCCCGGDYWDDKPEEDRLAAYTPTELLGSKIAAFASLLMPLTYVILCFVGSAKLIAAVDDIVGGIVELVRWVLDDMGRMAEALAPTGNYASELQSFQTEYESQRRDAEDIIRDYAENALIGEFKGIIAGFGFPSLVPAIFMVIGAIMAALKIRQCVPMLVVFVCFLLAAPFGVASTAFFVIGTPIHIVCDEVQAQLDKQPGVFQNYVVPQCGSVNPIQMLEDTLNDLERDTSGTACTELNTLCSNTSTWDSSQGERFWSCAQYPTCATVDEVIGFLDSFQIKAGVPENPCGSGNGTSCTIRECGTRCTDLDLRQSAANTYDAVETAQRVLDAIRSSEIMKRWSTCDGFFDHILETLGFCKNLPTGMSTLSVGFLFVVLGNIVGIVVFTIGSKRFFDGERFKGGNAAFGNAQPSNMNAAASTSAAGYQPVPAESLYSPQSPGSPPPHAYQQQEQQQQQQGPTKDLEMDML